MKIKMQVFIECDACGKSVQERDETVCAVCKATIKARIAIDRAKSFKHRHWKYSNHGSGLSASIKRLII